MVRLFVHSRPEDEPLEWQSDDLDLPSMRDAEKEIATIDMPIVDGFEPIYLAVYCLKY